MPSRKEGLEFVSLLERCAHIVIVVGKTNSADDVVDDGVALANWAKKFQKVINNPYSTRPFV